jgi:haloalkane dehalogenase
MADALRGFVRELGLERFTLVVHATGGPGGLAMAVRERARLDGLVISNSFAWPLTEVPRVRTIVRLVSSRVFAWLVVRFNLLARIAARQGRRHAKFSTAERAAVLGPYQSMDARAHLANLLYGLRRETAFFSRLEQSLPSLAEVPTLLLFGAEDNGYKAGFLERFRRALPHSESVVLQRAAHFITEDAPAEYTAALRDWLVTPRSGLYSEAGLSSDTGLRSEIGPSSDIGPRS